MVKVISFLHTASSDDHNVKNVINWIPDNFIKISYTKIVGYNLSINLTNNVSSNAISFEHAVQVLNKPFYQIVKHKSTMAPLLSYQLI